MDAYLWSLVPLPGVNGQRSEAQLREVGIVHGVTTCQASTCERSECGHGNWKMFARLMADSRLLPLPSLLGLPKPPFMSELFYSACNSQQCMCRPKEVWCGGDALIGEQEVRIVARGYGCGVGRYGLLQPPTRLRKPQPRTIQVRQEGQGCLLKRRHPMPIK